MDRRSQIVQRLLATITEHFNAFREPVPIKMLSAKYSRALQHEGGFPECIEELRKNGQIRVFLKKSGAKVIVPSGIEIEVPEAVELKNGTT